MNRIVVFIGILAILLNGIELNDAVVFKLTNFECESYNQSWVVIHTCRLKVMKRNQIGGYFNATILHPASVISVNGQVYKKANGYKPWVIATKFDACRFITNYNYNLIAKVVGVLFLEFTNLNHSCPYNVSCLMYSITILISHIFFDFTGITNNEWILSKTRTLDPSHAYGGL
ncbi:uncharacterized protein Dwil_GK27159 [Drosophila willistoni]|uniref:Uncharacterized protein n=1 Tax=Drosophila willistoni TaxID=7260 RepID=A0A0Q9X6B2_DROWI|nr:uncharacterized protein Dwil_GK27159 [Drosophila willistoni]